MRILTVVYDLDIGGTQRAAVTFANAYARMGHESQLLVTAGRGPRESDLLDEVHVVGPDIDPSFISDAAPDLIHLHGHGPSEAYVRALHEQCPDARWVEQNVFAHITPWTDLIDSSFLFSRWCEHQYASSAGVHAPSMLVPNPIDTSPFYRDVTAAGRVRNSLGIPHDALVMGRIGQPQAYKWSPMMVAAFDQQAAVDERAWLLLVGAPAEILDVAARSPHADRITLVDRLEGDDALRAHYSAMDIFVHAAGQGETFGYVLAEAALCEVPIVTLSTPWADNSQGEVIGHRVGGLVATTARGFAASVRELALDAELRMRLGVQGRERILTTYDSAVVAASALEAAEMPASAKVMDGRELLAAYSLAVDPPSGVRQWAAVRQMWPTVAWMSGVQPFSWLARTTLNRWGISRHGISRERGGRR